MSAANCKADVAYQLAHQEARDLQVHIEVLLHDLPAPKSDGALIDWADVGTVTEVVARLNSVIAFLRGNEK
jgi:hypothetical protein